MDVFDEIGITAFYVEHFAGGAIDLDAPIALDKDEFHHPFVRSHIDAINFCGNGRRDILPGITDSQFLQLMNGKPIFGFSRAPLHRVCKDNAAAVFLPAEKQAGNRNEKEENKEGSSGCTMYLTGELENVRLSFPGRIDRFAFFACRFLQQNRLLNDSKYYQKT